MNWLALVAVIAISGACGTRRASVPAAPEASVGAEIAASVEGCYVGAAPLFGDSASAEAEGQNRLRWLVLQHAAWDPAAPDDGRQGQVVTAGERQALKVSWTVRGDSIEVAELAFPAARWVLVPTPDGLVGRAVFVGDAYFVDAEGRREPQRTEWPARLRRIECAAVPDSRAHGA